MGKRGFELSNGLHSLGIDDPDVIRVERQCEETSLVWIANDQELFGPGLPEERVGVYARPTDLAAYGFQ